MLVQPQAEGGRVGHHQEVAPHPVDDRGDRRHQVDERHEGRLHPRRGVLADVEGGQHRERESERHRHPGDRHGPDQHRFDAEDVGLGLPGALGEEAPSVTLEGGHRLPGEERTDAASDDEDGGTNGARARLEDAVATGGLAGQPTRGRLNRGQDGVLSGE